MTACGSRAVASLLKLRHESEPPGSRTPLDQALHVAATSAQALPLAAVPAPKSFLPVALVRWTWSKISCHQNALTFVVVSYQYCTVHRHALHD